MLRKIIYIPLIASLMICCSSDDSEEPLITVDIGQGLLGEWHVESDCQRTHIWTFYDDGTFGYTFNNDTNIGSYSLSGRNLTTRGFNDIIGGENNYTIMVLTQERLELDDKADFGIDYKLVRMCD